MEKKEIENIDILSQIDILGELGDLSGNNSSEIKEKQKINFLENSLKDDFSEDNNNIILNESNEVNISTSIESNINKEEVEKIEKNEVITKKETIEKPKLQVKIFDGILFFLKYVATSAFIFVVLLVITNYSAYINIVMSYINEEEFSQNEQLLISSVKASYIKEKIEEKVEKKQIEFKEEDIQEYSKNIHSMEKMINKTSGEVVELDIEITPYENRVIIPKIGKNIPLLNVKNQMVSSEKKLNNIFMKELENGIVKYPGSADPGKIGNSFIFGHSSNFPWIKGDYNEVFASLYKLQYGDEVIVYYGQEKFKYVIREKKVINPNNVSLLKRNNNKSEITLMTCWPIGTTLNRLIVTGELVKE